MLLGHHKSYNAHALGHILKPVHTPQAELGVQDGETHAPVKGYVIYPKVLKPVQQPDVSSSSYEYTQIDGFSDPVTLDNFGKSNYIGNQIEGWGY